MKNRTGQVILASGELCLKSDLNPGMQLMNERSQAAVLQGIEVRNVPSFEIRPLKGEPFLLGFDQNILAASLKTEETLLLRATDYNNQASFFKSSFGLMRTPLDFPKTDTPLDPYFLGLLLGDGCFRSSQLCLTTSEPELIELLYETSKRLKWPLRIVQTPGNLSNAYYFKNFTSGASLKTHLKNLGLWDLKSNAKFIPKTYLYTDRDSRLALLAGLLDTDGSLLIRFYEIVSSSFQMAEDIAFLARSLGFGVVESEKVIKETRYVRLYIYGDYADLPLRVHRKKAWFLKKTRHPEKVTFTVHSVGIQEVVYLFIDSYMTGDFTVRKGDVYDF
ncbi:hypothetical protein AGMMS49949_03090 [Alphaproteobacteria bacterium]|nr:hypothetical protein AGMMS49949_03090 [Alphaproteobacteria bacterium]GHS97950.1 hypothetical protein AGMMS50296_5300 [Alphaproteobacteria bacterium]